MSLWSQLITVPHTDPYIQRRGRLLAIVLLAVIALAVLFLPMVLFRPNPILGLSLIVVCSLIYGGLLRLAHSGRIMLSAWLFCLTMIAAIVGGTMLGGDLASTFYLVLAINAAAIVLPPSHIWRVLLIALICVMAIVLRSPQLLQTERGPSMLIGAIVLLTGTAIFCYLGSRATEAALRTSDANAERTEAAQRWAEAQARELEAHAAALSVAEERLRSLVATLETPAVAVADGVLLAPIVGAIDTRRAQQITERLLASIAGQRVRLLILDLAGVAMVDTAVTGTLLQIAQAVRLLGCKVVITGIAPAVAVTITSLGASLEGIETARSPQEALAASAATIIAPLAAR
jgi:rsbT co-antagonist protein RsbR